MSGFVYYTHIQCAVEDGERFAASRPVCPRSLQHCQQGVLPESEAFHETHDEGKDLWCRAMFLFLCRMAEEWSSAYSHVILVGGMNNGGVSGPVYLR